MWRAVLVFLIVLSAFPSPGEAYEIDNYSGRYSPPADATTTLDNETNRRMQKIVRQLNTETGSCDWDGLFSALKYALDDGIEGEMEHYAETSSSIPRQKRSKKSIYDRQLEWSLKNLPHKIADWFGAGVMTVVGLESVVNINGHLVGTDKLGHFMCEGYTYYQRIKGGSSFASTLQHGYDLEEGKFGLTTTGIKSYADLVANYNGLKFWECVKDCPIPYFRCNDGKFEQVRRFSWANYVDDAWDEAVNCSTFLPELENIVNQNISALETTSGRRYQCPIKDTCQEMSTKYNLVRSWVLHPECLKPSNSRKTGTNSTKPQGSD